MANYYYIQQAIPQPITIKPKQNISGLVGLVISSCYYLSIKDYNTFNTTINSLIDVYNLITNNSFGLVFNKDVETLSSGIDNIISSNFICIQKVNNRIVSGDLDDEYYIPQNIDVLKSFIINKELYNANDQNGGEIEIRKRVLSGTKNDYVTSFNGRTGIVQGGITTIIINNRKQPFEADRPGLIKLDNLARKDRYVATINGLAGNNFTVLQQIDLTLNLSISANATNRGLADISQYFIFNNNNVLTGNNHQEIFVLSTVLDNDKSAVNKKYLTDGSVKNENIISGMIYNKFFNLPLDYVPLHFYDSNGIWQADVQWSYQKFSDHITVLMDDTWYNNYSQEHGNSTLIWTAMRVTEDE